MSRKRRSGNNDWKQTNEAFLAAKAQEAGVTVLDNGVIMQRLPATGTIPDAAPLQTNSQPTSQTVPLADGTRRRPKPGSVVYVNYTGRLIDGTVFDTTEGDPLPALFRVRELIMGWQIALTRMSEGDRYRIWIPAKWAYGAMKQPDIPAWSTLEFDLELVKIAQL